MQNRFLTFSLVLMVASLLLLSGCAKPNMQLFSNWYEKADSSQKGKVIITTGYLTIVHEPSERELASFPKVRARMEALGFQIVDSISKADMILNISIDENGGFGCHGFLWSTAQWTSPASVSSNGSIYWHRGMNSGGEICGAYSGYDTFTLRLSRIEQTDKPPTEIWFSFVRTKSEYLIRDFDKIVDMAIAQYGKETSESLVYRPKKSADTLAAR